MIKLLYSEMCVPGLNKGSGIQFFIFQQLELPWFGARQPNHFCLFIFALVVALTRIKICILLAFTHIDTKFPFFISIVHLRRKPLHNTSKSKAAAHAELAYY